MIPWQLVELASMPGGKELRLCRRGDEFIIWVDGLSLMTSRAHGSEEVLAELGCKALGGRPQARVLVGGLGMGYTLAAALGHLGPEARVEVAELVPAVVEWNRTHLAHLAGRPLEDPRVTVRVGDLARILKTERESYDAILNDVDNGPRGLVLGENNWLYSRAGLAATHRALRPGGILTVWSVGPDRAFSGRLRQAGFEARQEEARAHGRKGRRHTIWVARRSP